MVNGCNMVIASRWLRSLLFLALVYCGQVSPLNHSHHSHEHDLLEVEIAALPVEADVGHSSDHRHAGDLPHGDSHSHTLEQHVDWHIARSQYTRVSTLDARCLPSMGPVVLTDDDGATGHILIKPPRPREPFAIGSMHRGPPITA